MLEFREALVEQLIQKFKRSVCFLDDDDMKTNKNFHFILLESIRKVHV